MNNPQLLDTNRGRHIVDTGFLDTGGSDDFAALNMCTTDIVARKIYVRDTMFWKLSDKDKISFASIRNDIAILQQQISFYMLGCETNNYGKSEMESLRRDYGIKMHGFWTGGKLKSKETIEKGEVMDKHDIVRFTNSWRQNARDDPNNQLLLGQIVIPEEKTEEMVRWMNQLDSFVEKQPDSFGHTGNTKYGAEGTGHDDGIMAFLGNVHMIRTKIFGISQAPRGVGTSHHPQNIGTGMGMASPDTKRPKDKVLGRAMGKVDDSYLYEGM